MAKDVRPRDMIRRAQGLAQRLWSRIAVGLLCAATVVLFAEPAAAQGPTVEKIVKRGQLLCSGATVNSPGFAAVDAGGHWRGMDVDICRALTVAILGDETKLSLVPVSFVQRFPALQSGDIDVIAKNTAWNLTRTTDLGLQFSWPYYYTGVGILVYKSLGVTKGADLNGATICVSSGTTLEKEIADFFKRSGKPYKLLSFENGNERDQAYIAHRCDALVNGFAQLAATRAFAMPNPDDHVILPDFLGKEADGVLVRRGDELFLNIVNWTIFALFEAEELGITAENIDTRKNDPDPRVGRLLGSIPGVGKKLGLRETWAYEVIKTVGNYGQIYDRNLGKDSPLKLDRAYNRLWDQGGLMFSPPFD
jgi:general L-amino acid transport system substrate-binding protein